MQTYRLYIDGEWVDTGTRYEVRNPAKVVQEIKQASRVEYRFDKAGIVHMPI